MMRKIKVLLILIIVVMSKNVYARNQFENLGFNEFEISNFSEEEYLINKNISPLGSIATLKTGYYKAANYGNVGYGTYRHYIKNESHQSNSGIFRVNAQTFS